MATKADAARLRELKAGPLPEWDSPVIDELFSGRETIEAARFLLRRRDNPPTMSEWVDESRRIFGKTNAQTGRRLRYTYEVFTVEVGSGVGATYRVTGWNRTAVGSGATSKRLQAEVFNLKGRHCAMCGYGPPEVKLQIDHIVPVSWGGATEVDNLEPLCVDHNQGKRAFFESLDSFGDVIRRSIDLPTPWERIGSLLIALAAEGKRTPTELLPIVGRETHAGDPARRLRDLRTPLGWEIKAHRRKVGKRTKVEYELVSARPWPPEGPHEAVKRYERARKKQKASE